ncbi:restriction endonuclease subunit S [Arcobacter sp. CECT 8985]|uniref:restriction endonuclease subunit S n=1 Tax=Arcobacter sp. CECT 8985 TaxID=1935424 RepID=UPI00100BF3CD|nr:restriction endonuclease subunit S [Arcobacter sp. CECT 8985]RXJ88058.1 type I restriction endonuclease subunit S [Arcobacter sp. CECT 8985]
MKNEKLRVPKLRFKEFSGEWEEKSLEKLCIKISDGIHSTPVYDELGEYYFVNGNNLKNGEIILDEKTKRVSKEEYEKHYRELNDNTILMSINGTIGNIAFYKNEKIMLGKSASYINIETSKTNKYFISNQLLSNKIQYFYTSELTGSTIKNLSLRTIKNTPILFPSKQEQEKIASFLSSIDKKINQLSKKDELLQNYKKAMMQKIFSQKLRFKKADGSDYPKWEEIKLKEVLDYEQPTNYIVRSTEYSDSYDIPVLTAGKTFILGYTNEKEGIYSKGSVIIFDDFTTTNHYVDFDFKIKSSAMKLLKEKNKNVNLKFVYEFIQRLHFPLGEHKRYWISEYSYLKIKLPCVEEQTKIANLLSSLDTKISQNKKVLEETQKFKKALLQKMFV